MAADTYTAIKIKSSETVHYYVEHFRPTTFPFGT